MQVFINIDVCALVPLDLVAEHFRTSICCAYKVKVVDDKTVLRRGVILSWRCWRLVRDHLD